MNGTLQSSNCDLHVDISLETVHVEVYLAKATSYAGMVMLLSCIQVSACRPSACLLFVCCSMAGASPGPQIELHGEQG